ncbi:MAG TPA: ATP phosphoribosyltransferase regulatory subunit [Limnobacter sp.]|uniref:ATP phosphoribosyltransferase regulatory subunit n=1 Tax=Limnobacter sp. TaxID=2003368 RepID=UPI002ED97FDF
MSAWLLPESVADVLPSEARRIEELRRILLDRFRVYGYELVMPPMLEYTTSLLAKADASLDLQTFKLLDQASGRMLGLRADTTPQVARIDAHILNRKGVTRLCYCGPVLHTQALGLHTTREPLQCGAELYGCGGIEADLEMLNLAVDTLNLSGLKNYRLALSHAGLLAAVLDGEGLCEATVRHVHHALAQKDQPGLKVLLRNASPSVQSAVLAMLNLYGAVGGAQCVLKRAKATLPAKPGVQRILDDMVLLVDRLSETVSAMPTVLADLADLANFDYHSGLLFSAYVEACPNAVLRGGRYDDVGAVFGRARPATGFSVDLRELVALQRAQVNPKKAIRAPWMYDTALMAVIRQLRSQGEVVLQTLPGAAPEEEEFVCDRQLVLVNQTWTVAPMGASQEKVQ